MLRVFLMRDMCVFFMTYYYDIDCTSGSVPEVTKNISSQKHTSNNVVQWILNIPRNFCNYKKCPFQ